MCLNEVVVFWEAVKASGVEVSRSLDQKARGSISVS